MRTSKGQSAVRTLAVLQVSALQSRNIFIFCDIHRGVALHYKTSLTAYNSVKYCTFLDELFIVLRNRGIKDSVLIMNNASIHKTNEVKNLLELSGIVFLYFPPYFPFLNSIENMFLK
ncbi:hypothetical protein CDIK_3541 [Cucumispora dikerogammari]|nr:hypothetical protein CDIK_3541 [Cucumispora dikerogammari]